MPGPETHEKLSPSSSVRWSVCPRSLLSPDLPAGKAAEKGTWLHGLAAKMLVDERAVGDVPSQYAEGILQYVEHVMANGVTPIVERKFHSLTIPDFGGSIDALLVRDGALVVYDFKTGTWDVPAVDNTQLLCYASLAAEHFNAGQYHGVIVQPWNKKPQKVKVAEFPQAQIDWIRERARYAQENQDEVVPGEHCLWCPMLRVGNCAEGEHYARKRKWHRFKHLKSVLGN